MDEKTLLLLATTTAVLGIVGLYFLEELPRTQEVGTLAWTNETAALVLTKEALWIDLEQPTHLPLGECVQLSGHYEAGRFSNAYLTSAPPAARRDCP